MPTTTKSASTGAPIASQSGKFVPHGTTKGTTPEQGAPIASRSGKFVARGAPKGTTPEQGAPKPTTTGAPNGTTPEQGASQTDRFFTTVPKRKHVKPRENHGPKGKMDDITVDVTLPDYLSGSSSGLSKHTFWVSPRPAFRDKDVTDADGVTTVQRNVESGRMKVASVFKEKYDASSGTQLREQFINGVNEIIHDKELMTTSKTVFYVVEYLVCLGLWEFFIGAKWLVSLLWARLQLDKVPGVVYYKLTDLVRMGTPRIEGELLDWLQTYRRTIRDRTRQEKMTKLLDLVGSPDFDFSDPVSIDMSDNGTTDRRSFSMDGAATATTSNGFSLLREDCYPLSRKDCDESLASFLKTSAIFDDEDNLTKDFKDWISTKLVDQNINYWMSIWFEMMEVPLIEHTFELINSIRKENSLGDLSRIERKNFFEKNLPHIILGIPRISDDEDIKKARKMIGFLIVGLFLHPILPDSKQYPIATKLKELEATSVNPFEKKTCRAMLDEIETSRRKAVTRNGMVNDLQVKLLPSADSPFSSYLMDDFYSRSLNYGYKSFEELHQFMHEKFPGDYKRTVFGAFDDDKIMCLIESYIKTKKDKACGKLFFTTFIDVLKNIINTLGSERCLLAKKNKDLGEFIKKNKTRKEEHVKREFADKVIRKKAVESALAENDAKSVLFGNAINSLIELWTPSILNFINEIFGGVSIQVPSVLLKSSMAIVTKICDVPAYAGYFTPEFIDDWKKNKGDLKKNIKTTIQAMSSEVSDITIKFAGEILTQNKENLAFVKKTVIPIFIRDIVETLCFYQPEEGEELDEDDEAQMRDELETELYTALSESLKKTLRNFAVDLVDRQENEESEDNIFELSKSIRNFKKSNSAIFDLLRSKGFSTTVDRLENFSEWFCLDEKGVIDALTEKDFADVLLIAGDNLDDIRATTSTTTTATTTTTVPTTPEELHAALLANPDQDMIAMLAGMINNM